MPRRLDHQPAGAPLSDPEAEELARAMAAFATPSRLKLLFALIGTELTVEDLARATGLGETVVSQQLRVLRLLRLAAGQREGRHVRYRLCDDHVAELLAAVRHHGEHA
ncbi:MAG: helix-turn-helix transcriptional regulator, partial [Candidatus Dormibacteraeota bacterium]|nr:helix-turn-helix transcriptional regulator [Candidatus Dormibacteraeota bacterium]